MNILGNGLRISTGIDNWLLLEGKKGKRKYATYILKIIYKETLILLELLIGNYFFSFSCQNRSMIFLLKINFIIFKSIIFSTYDITLTIEHALYGALFAKYTQRLMMGLPCFKGSYAQAYWQGRISFSGSLIFRYPSLSRQLTISNPKLPNYQGMVKLLRLINIYYSTLI